MLRSNPEELVRKTIARFVDAEVIPAAQELDKNAEFPREIFHKLAGMGVFGIRYPRNKGGAGGNTTLYCIICEELARGLVSAASITAMQCLMGTNFLFHYGTDEMREKYFIPAMRGEKIGCFCMTEPDAGSDLGAITTRATEVDGGYLINGMKTWVTDGPEAGFYTVMCQTDPKKRLRGIGYFFVPRDFPGVSTSPRFDSLGTRSTPICEVAFKDVFIPKEYRLTPEGEGLNAFLKIIAEIRTMTAALALGLQRAAMDDSVKYSKERVASGQTIGKFQLIQAKIADMATNLEASRLMTYNAAAMIDHGKDALKEASMAKYFATEAACSAADECTRIFAGYGYSMEYSAQRYFRDSRFLLSGGGTHEVLRTNIARWVGV
ncbi:MAG: acyl-CoA dehydrogenase family protein [Pseudomonadota bacterium]